MFKVNNKRHQNDVNEFVLLSLNIFHIFFSAFFFLLIWTGKCLESTKEIKFFFEVIFSKCDKSSFQQIYRHLLSKSFTQWHFCKNVTRVVPDTYIWFNPAGIYLFKVYNRNIRTIYEIWQWRQFVGKVVLVSLLLTLNRFPTLFWCFHCSLKLVNAGWQALPIWNKDLNPLSANPTKWSNTLKQFVGNTRRIFECVWPFCEVGD